MFKLPTVDYTLFEPLISANTLQFHHGKHHKTYVDNLNLIIEKTPSLQGLSTLDEILLAATSLPDAQKNPLLNNAGQVFNHNLYWLNMVSQSESANLLEKHKVSLEEKLAIFGGIEGFKSSFKNTGLSQFGSGWVWLVIDQNGELKIISTSNAQTPIALGYIPVLTMDVWEHAYYLDYQNKRGDYIDQFFKLLNWQDIVLIIDINTYNLRKNKISNFENQV